jgi:hypothetical protein
MDIAVVWGTLLLGPPVGFGLMALIRKMAPKSVGRLLISSAALLSLVLLAILAKIAFISPLANISILSVGYLAYIVLCTAVWNLEIPALKILLGIVSSLPIAAGYLFAAFGMLAFMFAGFTSPPVYALRLDDRVCEVRHRSGGPSYGVYEVGLYQRWAVIPFIQQQKNMILIPEGPGQPPSFEDSCREIGNRT